MFTGIITDVGKILEFTRTDSNEVTMVVETKYNVETIDIGASIACNGTCLTVTKKEKGENSKNKLWFDLSPETLDKTNYKNIKKDLLINMERSLKIGDELGGHIVSGHVDCEAEVKSIENLGDNYLVVISIPKEFGKFMVDKGSVTINGISLTVNKVIGDDIYLNLIPHTWENTNFKKIEKKSIVNIEVDLFARYIERMLAKRN